MKITSWNINGVRAAVKKNFINEVIDSGADIYCVQETKAQADQTAEALKDLASYHIYSNDAERKGYSGVTIISKTKPLSISMDIGIEEHDLEGRVIAAEYEHFILVNVYVPNSGSGLKRLDYRATWDLAFGDYLMNLKEQKPVIVTGDFNVAHTSIDLKNDKSNYNKTSGYTQKEIDGLDYILSKGFKDAWRTLHPEEEKYTFWSMRTRARDTNAGWRIDYFLVDDHLWPRVTDSTIENEIHGSDHCPLSLYLDL